MEYRKLPHGDEQISIIGMGNSSLGASGEEEAEKTVTMALENGVNYFDMAAGDATPFPAYGRAVSGCRDNVYFQIHFGADYRSGKYGWTLNLDEIKWSIDWQLKAQMCIRDRLPGLVVTALFLLFAYGSAGKIRKEPLASLAEE